MARIGSLGHASDGVLVRQSSDAEAWLFLSNVSLTRGLQSISDSSQ